MTYKHSLGWKLNSDKGKGPAHALNRNGKNQPISRPLLKKGWRRVGTPKEREGDSE